VACPLDRCLLLASSRLLSAGLLLASGSASLGLRRAVRIRAVAQLLGRGGAGGLIARRRGLLTSLARLRLHLLDGDLRLALRLIYIHLRIGTLVGDVGFAGLLHLHIGLTLRRRHLNLCRLRLGNLHLRLLRLLDAHLRLRLLHLHLWRGLLHHHFRLRHPHDDFRLWDVDGDHRRRLADDDLRLRLPHGHVRLRLLHADLRLRLVDGDRRRRLLDDDVGRAALGRRRPGCWPGC
jgi:hypothetical protein